MTDAPTPLVALEIADCLASSGVCGVGLSQLLHARFPHARRSEVFTGVALASAIWHADLLLAEAEALDAKRIAGEAQERLAVVTAAAT